MDAFGFPASLSGLHPRIRGAKSNHSEAQRVTFTFSSTSLEAIPEPKGRMSFLGLGFVSQYFARQLKREGWLVTGTCRNYSKKIELEGGGIEVHLFDANKPEWNVLSNMKDYTHLLVSIPPSRDMGDPLMKNEDILRKELCSWNLRWLCYLSTTSVYGDCDGALVDENCPAKPTTELGQRRLAAEKSWLKLGHDLGIPAYAFRLGGVYGPGRSAIDTLLKQESLSEKQKMRSSRQFTSRVHVEDICQALRAAIEIPPSGDIYNIVDDDPTPREMVFAYASDLIKKKFAGRLKQVINVEESGRKGGRSVGGSKRVSNSRMKEELGVQLLYPTYKSGLQRIIEQME